MNIDEFKDKIKQQYTGKALPEKIELLLDIMDECYYMGEDDGHEHGYKNAVYENNTYLEEEEAYERGYERGYEDGWGEGWDEGQLDGKHEGYQLGFEEGKEYGFNEGYKKGAEEREIELRDEGLLRE